MKFAKQNGDLYHIGSRRSSKSDLTDHKTMDRNDFIHGVEELTILIEALDFNSETENQHTRVLLRSFKHLAKSTSLKKLKFEGTEGKCFLNEITSKLSESISLTEVTGIEVTKELQKTLAKNSGQSEAPVRRLSSLTSFLKKSPKTKHKKKEDNGDESEKEKHENVIRNEAKHYSKALDAESTLTIIGEDTTDLELCG